MGMALPTACHDDMNRIRGVTGAIPESFALDPYGNITQCTAFNGSAVPYPATAGQSAYATPTRKLVPLM